MVSYRAQVRNGRLVLDAPTDLPEGEVVELAPVDPFSHLDDADELDDEERVALRASLRRGIEEMRAGDLHDADDVIREMME